MDDIACAATLVLTFADESSLRTGSRELVKLADKVERTANTINAPSKGLAAPARLLFDTNTDDTKIEAMMLLEEIIIALKKAAAALEEAHCHRAENLLHACETRPPKPPSNLLTQAAKLVDIAAGISLPRDNF